MCQTLSIQLSHENNQVPIEKVNVTIESFEEFNITNIGGVITGPDEVHVYGDASVVYKLQRPIDVNIFSKLDVTLVKLKQAGEVYLCLYEEKDDALGISPILEDEFRCHTISSSRTKVNIGESFGYRSTSVNYFRIIQYDSATDGDSILSNITIESGEKVNVIGEDGECNDENAAIFVRAGSHPQCLCQFGYIASNGGKFLGEYDACVKCIPESSCAFDGDMCTTNRECLLGLCQNGICTAGVSLIDSTKTLHSWEFDLT